MNFEYERYLTLLEPFRLPSVPCPLASGTPKDVDAAVRHLAENVFHKGGKLVLSGSTTLPEETPVENVRAMVQAARKYGSQARALDAGLKMAAIAGPDEKPVGA